MSNWNSKIIILRFPVELAVGCVGSVRKRYTISYICNIRFARNRFYIIRYVIFYIFDMCVFLLSHYFDAFLRQRVKSPLLTAPVIQQKHNIIYTEQSVQSLDVRSGALRICDVHYNYKLLCSGV